MVGGGRVGGSPVMRHRVEALWPLLQEQFKELGAYPELAGAVLRTLATDVAQGSYEEFIKVSRRLLDEVGLDARIPEGTWNQWVQEDAERRQRRESASFAGDISVRTDGSVAAGPEVGELGRELARQRELLARQLDALDRRLQRIEDVGRAVAGRAEGAVGAGLEEEKEVVEDREVRENRGMRDDEGLPGVSAIQGNGLRSLRELAPMPSFSLGGRDEVAVRIAPSLPKYSGSGDLDAWILQLEAAIRLVGGSRRKTLVWTLTQLEGSALEAVNAWLAGRAEEEDPSWKEVVEVLEKLFGPADPVRKAVGEWDGLRMERKETVAEYATRFRKVESSLEDGFRVRKYRTSSGGQGSWGA